MSSGNKASADQLKTALGNFEAVLTQEQKTRLQSIAAVPDATAVIAFTTQLDNENAKRGSRCVATRLLTFLQSIQQFTTVVDTFVSSNPAIPALVWGSVKLAVLVCRLYLFTDLRVCHANCICHQLTSNNASYFDKLSALLMSFSKHCPRYSEYQILYADSVGLRVAVSNFFAVVIDCCTQAVQVISKSGASPLLHHLWPPLSNLLVYRGERAFWRPFKTDELGRFEKEIRECKSEVDAEISRALHQTIFQEQQLQLVERKAAARHRDRGSIFRVRVDKSNEEERRWRIETDERQARSRQQDLLDRLSDYDYMTPLRRASMKRHGQTATWLRESTEFANWMADPRSNIFLLSGKLGSGKTVTTACTVGHLFAKSGNDHRVIYFFCQFDNAKSLSASLILSALIRQFLNTKTLPKSIEICLVNVLKVPCPEARDLAVLLKDVLKFTKCSFIFIDAIDECAKSEWKVLLEVLQDILISCSSVVKVFLSVRQGMVEEMKDVCEWHYQATMSSSEVNSNIKSYIEGVLAERKDSGQLIVDNPELINEITDALVEEANGMLVCPIKFLGRVLTEIGFFGWLFKIEDICRQVCDRDIRKTIRKLPKDLPETYNGILSRIARMGNAKLAKKVFSWVATAKRPLLLEELREAIAIEPLQPYSDRERLVNNMSQIVSCCENLIVLDEQDRTVQFTHQTVKVFLLDSFRDQANANFHFEQRKTDHYVGEICVTYLNFNDFKRKLIRKGPSLPTPEAILRASLSVGPNSTSKSVWKRVAWFREHRKGSNTNPVHVFTGTALHNNLEALREMQMEHPFLSYAAEYWLHHCADFKRAKTQTWHLWEELLLSEEQPAELPWEHSEWLQRTRTIRRWICDHEHVALFSLIESSETPFAEEEMQCILNFVIEQPSLRLFNFVLRECHSLARVINESLIVAVGGRHLWAVDKLLAEGADPNWRALGSAYRQQDSRQHKLSITNADINATAKKYVGLTALQAAAMGGDLQLVNKLITIKADINAEAYQYSGRTALQAAAQEGHSKVVGKLLRAKADVNAGPCRDFGRTALQAAAEQGQLEVVEMLLIAKADVNAGPCSKFGRTALQAAAEQGHLEVIDWLLTANADVNAEAGINYGRTAIQAAAEKGHLEVADRLLAAKADVNGKAGANSGRTALQAAAEKGDLKVVERLLTAKADVNGGASSSSGRTALQAAAQQGHLKVVEMLLVANADVNAGPCDDFIQTTLQEQRNLDLIGRLLLTANVEVNAEADINYGRTAIQAAAEKSHLEVFDWFVTADPVLRAEVSGNYGSTALKSASEQGNFEVVEMLLIAKAHVNGGASKSSGRTALQAAAEQGHLRVIERLLTAKADVNAEPCSYFGRTALQAAAEKGHLEVVEMLLTAKAHVNGEASKSFGRTALQAAAEQGHLRVVQRLLTAKANVNAGPCFNFGRTALQAAAEKGYLEVIEMLLTADADVNAKAGFYYGRTAIQAAAGKGHLKVVDLLLASKANVNAKACVNSGRTALQAAAEQGHLEVVEMLLIAKTDVNARPGGIFGRTALQAAAEQGHLRVIERLLTAKADVNAGPCSNFGRTALQAAAEQGHLEVVEMLLIAKADVDAGPCSDFGRTALQAAAGKGHFEVVEMLLIAKADVNAGPCRDFGRTALQAAAEQGQLEVVEMLLIAKADVDAGPCRDFGRTALQAAAEKGHLEVVEMLLIAKAHVNARPCTGFGRTALQAAEQGHLEVIDRLLTADADVNAEAGITYGRTALQAAAEKGDLKVVGRLLAANADVSAEAGIIHGRTAIQAAAEKGHMKVVDWLLTAKADVNAGPCSPSGRTALQAAAEKGHLEVVEMLLAAKADVNGGASNPNGRTALQAAAEQGHLKVVERLLIAKADVNAGPCSDFGRTALQAAAEKGHLEVVDRLLTANADVNAKAGIKYGRTALKAAAENGHSEVVDRLLAV